MNIDAFDQLGNYVDWLTDLVNDTDYHPVPQDLQKDSSLDIEK